MVFICSLSVQDCERQNSNKDITIATTDLAANTDSMDTDNNCHISVVSGSRDDEIQLCLQRLLALG